MGLSKTFYCYISCLYSNILKGNLTNFQLASCGSSLSAGGVLEQQVDQDYNLHI